LGILLYFQFVSKFFDIVFGIFFSNKGMLSAIAIVARFAQNCPKLPNFAKISPKTKAFICRGGAKACAHHVDFQNESF
jgi:hypothetical protein